MFKKKLLLLNTTMILGLSSTVAIPTVFAETNTQQIQQANENIQRVDKELSQLEKQILRVEEAMRDNNKMISQTEKDIKNTKAQVKDLEKEISELNKSIEKRKDILAQRAVAYQESGGSVDYIDVLFGAEDFGDFINRVYAVSQIATADKELIDQFEDDKVSLEKKRSSVNKKLEELESMKTELNGMKTLIQKQKEENDKLKAQLVKEKQSSLNKRNELQAIQNRAAQAQVQETAGASESTTKNLNKSQSKAESSSKSKSTPAKPTPTQNKGSVDTVVNAGYKYIGNSVYVWGGGRSQYDIDNGRFDCSGFVHWAFGQAGYKVGATTDQLKYSGTRVSVQNMQRGDIVFFDTYKKDGHVGIYIGNGKFIGSQSNKGVSIEDLSSGYWKGVFNGRVNRVIK